jgi:hypothetical protein
VSVEGRVWAGKLGAATIAIACLSKAVRPIFVLNTTLVLSEKEDRNKEHEIICLENIPFIMMPEKKKVKETRAVVVV